MRYKILPIGTEVDAIPVAKQERAIQNALDGTAKDIKVDYLVTIETWKHKPKFVIEKSGQYQRDIFTEDEIYGYVTGGTRPHEIRAKNAPRLAFQTGYSAKTRPNVIRSNVGGRSGPTVFAMSVHHPGTEARNFEDVITEKWAKEWPRNLQRAIFSEVF